MSSKSVTTLKPVMEVLHNCDVCGVEVRNPYKCWACNCDLCSECTRYIDTDPIWGGCTGDYPPKSCTPCLAKIEELTKETAALNEVYEEAVEKAFLRWKGRHSFTSCRM